MGSTLKSILRQPLDPEDIQDIVTEMDSDGPRGAAILAGVLVEEVLRLLLVSKMVRLTQNEVDALFGTVKPLSSFSAKIDVGYAFGCYGPLTKDDLHTIRDVRNAFAHARRLIDFDTKEVAQRCERLHVRSRLAPGTTRQLFTMGGQIPCAWIVHQESSSKSIFTTWIRTIGLARSIARKIAGTTSSGRSTRGP